MKALRLIFLSEEKFRAFFIVLSDASIWSAPERHLALPDTNKRDAGVIYRQRLSSTLKFKGKHRPGHNMHMNAFPQSAENFSRIIILI